MENLVHLVGFIIRTIMYIQGVSKTFGEWFDVSTATWARCARMHMAIQRYVEKRHVV